LDPLSDLQNAQHGELAASVETTAGLVIDNVVGVKFPHVRSHADNSSHSPDARDLQWQPFDDRDVVEWICEA